MVLASFALLFALPSNQEANTNAAAPSATALSSSQLPYVSSTIDVATHQTTPGNYAGNNFLGPTGMAYDPNNGNLYAGALEYGSVHGNRTYQNENGSLLVINATTMTVTGHIYVGFMPSYVVFDSVNKLLYVSDIANYSISVVNSVSNSVVATIQFSSSSTPLDMVVDPINGTVYADVNSAIYLISGTSVIGSVSPFPDYPAPYSMVYDNADGYIYTAFFYAPVNGSPPTSGNYSQIGAVGIFNPANNSYVSVIHLGGITDWLSYANGNVYATGLMSNNITVISSTSIVKNISFPHDSVTSFVNPVTGNIYISALSGTNSTNNVNALVQMIISSSNVYLAIPFTFNITMSSLLNSDVYVVNPSTGSVVNTIHETILSEFMAFSGNGTAYIDNTITGAVQEVTPSFSVSTLSLTGTPTSTAYDPSNNYVYVTDMITGQVMVYDASTGFYVSTIDVGGFPIDITYASSNGEMYVTNALNQSVDIISGTSMVGSLSVGHASLGVTAATVVTTAMSISLQTGAMPMSEAFDPADGYLYVSTYNMGTSVAPGGVLPQIDVFNTLTNKFVSTVNDTLYNTSSGAPDALLGMVYDPADQSVYVSALIDENATFGLFELQGTQVVKTINTSIVASVEESPNIQPVYDPSNGELLFPFSWGYVTLNGNSVTYTSLNVNSPTETLYRATSGMAFDKKTNQIMVSDFFSVYVLNDNVYDTGALTVLNASTLQIEGNVTVGQGSAGVAVTSSGDVYVANEAYGTVSILSPYSTNTGAITLNLLTNGAWVTMEGQSVQMINGTYSAILNPGYYYVNASLPGYYSYSNYVYVGPSSNFTLNISLRSMSGYGYLVGHANPSDLILQANNMSVPIVSGYFNQTLPSGTYFVSAFAAGYTPAEFQVNISRGAQTNLTVSLNRSTSNVLIKGHVAPFNSTLSYSVLVNGTTTLVNSTGYFVAYVPQGTYSVSVYEQGYFPTSLSVTATSNVSLYFDLTPEPAATSVSSNGTASAQGYNTTVANVTVNNGAVSVNFNASANGTLVMQIPYTSLQNITLSQLLNSKIYISGKEYSNFTVTLTSNYTVFVTVKGLSGDPTLYWVYSSDYKVPGLSSGGLLSGYLLYVTIGVVIVIAVVGLVYATTRLRRR